VDTGDKWMDESFEIKLRNRKKDAPVEIRVVEHLYRWSNWEITASSDDFVKKDSQTIEFRIPVKAGRGKNGDLHGALFLVTSALWNFTLTILLTPCSCIVTP
jgi:hypothetical protein